MLLKKSSIFRKFGFYAKIFNLKFKFPQSKFSYLFEFLKISSSQVFVIENVLYPNFFATKLSFAQCFIIKISSQFRFLQQNFSSNQFFFLENTYKQKYPQNYFLDSKRPIKISPNITLSGPFELLPWKKATKTLLNSRVFLIFLLTKAKLTKAGNDA